MASDELVRLAEKKRERGGMTLRGREGDEEVTNTVQEKRDFTDKNIMN